MSSDSAATVRVSAAVPGTAWEQLDDPSKFVHLFTFRDEAAHESHGNSEAVRRFEDAYQPVLVGGPVVFTDYRLVASNQRT